jgi:hypothetical protein
VQPKFKFGIDVDCPSGVAVGGADEAQDSLPVKGPDIGVLHDQGSDQEGQILERYVFS